jgi:MFS superfamily sulfate permease-like transporter
MTGPNLVALLPTVVAMVVVILAQSAATSRAYALRYGDSFDENADLMGLGLANAAAAISGTFVVNGSPTKTEMVDSAGGRSQVSQLTAGVIVLAVLLFLTGPLAYMPNAVLASVVFLIGLKLIDLLGMTKIMRLRRGEFAVAAVTTATVVVFGVEQGIILAMGLSILEHVYHSYRPYDALVVADPKGDPALVPLSTREQVVPGLVVYRFGAGLYYANASRFTEEIMDLVEEADPPVAWLGISGATMHDIDYSGADTIRQIVEELRSKGVTLAISELSPVTLEQLDAYELTEKIGKDRLFASVRDLVEAYAAATGTDAATEVGSRTGEQPPVPGGGRAADAPDDSDGKRG